MKKVLLPFIAFLSLIQFSEASFDINLSIGSRSDEVKKVQTFLGIESTGYFGNSTAGAVKIFQKKNNLPQTGYWGPATRKLASSVSVASSTPTFASTSSSSSVVTPQASLIVGCYSVNGFSTVTGLSCSGNGACQTGTFFDKNNNKCVSSLAYCQSLNGQYATYNSSTNSCECLPGYSLDSKNTCVVQKTGYQVCADMNATWDGVSKNNGGGFSCSCKTGYISDGKTCTPQNGYQVCSQAYPNETWDGTYSSDGKFNCICLSGYVLNSAKTGCEPPKVNVTLPSSYYTPSYSSYGLGRNKGEVVLKKYGCDYYIVETSLGYSLLEWYGGYDPDEDDILYGNLNSYGFKDITTESGNSSRAWIDDYMLSKSSAVEKYYDKCN